MTTTSPYSVAIQNAFQAAALSIPFQFWTTAPNNDVTPPIAGVPQDISGWHFMFTMKKRLEDDDADAIFIFDWLIAAGAGISGKTSVTVPAATINTLEAKFMYFWDLRGIVPPSTDPTELLAGTVYLNPSVGQRLVPELGTPAAHTTIAAFIVPSVNKTVTISIDATSWLSVGMNLIIGANAGNYQVNSITNTTDFVGKNSGGGGSASPGTVIPSGTDIIPA